MQSLGLDRESKAPVVILQEESGDRVLPIWIGPGEASAIAMQLADMKFARPLTHDLLVDVLRRMGGALEKVLITRVEDNTYFAEMVVRRNGSTIPVDARPSDSIAVALRVGAPIFADDSLFNQGVIEISEGETVAEFVEDADTEAAPPEELRAEELKERLRKLDPEDFGRFTP